MFDNCFKGSGQIDKWMNGRREGQKDRRKEGGINSCFCLMRTLLLKMHFRLKEKVRKCIKRNSPKKEMLFFAPTFFIPQKRDFNPDWWLGSLR